MAKVDFRNVRKSYGALEVIHGVDARVADGEFIVIVGPSGCGKSTLLRMVAGLEAITAGEIVIGDRVVNELEPKDRDIAMVFQNYALYPHMSVYDNMAYGLRIRGLSKAAIDAAVQRAAGILELAPLLVTSQESMYTTVIGIRRMIVGGDAANEWQLIMATAMLALLPPAVVVITMQRWFVKGLVETEK